MKQKQNNQIEYEEGQVPGSKKVPLNIKLKKISVFLIVVCLILTIFPLINRLGPWLLNPGLKGPYLSWSEDPRTTMTISIQTPENCKLKIEYGKADAEDFTNSIEDSEKGKFHVFTLRNLEPDTEYKYKVASPSRDDIWGLDSKTYTFKTAPNKSIDFKFLIYGDNRPGVFQENNHRLIVQAMLKEKDAAFTINVGDIVRRSKYYEQWDRFFWEIKELAATKPYFVSIGNHEYDEGDDPDYGANYRKYFNFPQNGKKEMYYSFNYSNAHFVALNMSTSSLLISQREIDWLNKDLEKFNGTDTWKIIYFHVPPYSSGGHGENKEIIKKMVPLFEKYKVVVFSGHDHHYEHMEINGIHYFITGGGGAPLNVQNNKKSYSKYMEITFCYTLVNVEDDKLTITTKRIDGSIVDEVEIENPNK